MTTIKERLTSLERIQRKSRPALIFVLRAEQEGEPTPEQATEIAQAERMGGIVRIIRIVAAEDLSEKELEQYR